MMKKLTVIILLCALCLCVLTGCGDAVIGPAPTAAQTQSTPNSVLVIDQADSGPKGAEITLKGNSASVEGSGVSVSGSTVTIASPGSYSVAGTLDDGCIIVDTGEVKGDVTLTLKGAEITCLSGPAIHVIEAKNFDLVLEDGTLNRLVSGSEESVSEVKQNGAALFCEDDLDILGTGSLEIWGYINNGITCKDDLDIKDGTIAVTAVYNGIKGSESVEIYGGSISVKAGNDGVKTSSAKKEGKGFILIEGGMLDVTADGDGIAAETELTINGGEISVMTSGEKPDGSCKALKAKTLLTIGGGTLKLDSEDHALHCAGDMLLSGGTLTVSSRGGKGISAHGTLELAGSAIKVTAADDGIETLGSLIVSDGEIDVLAGEDGLKAGDKSTGTGTIEISGGTLTVSAYGDPVDAKGGAVITGGSFAGVGSANTAKGFAGNSTQRSLLFRFSGGEGTSAQVVSEHDEVIGTIPARCGYTYALFSSSALNTGVYRLVDGTLYAEAIAG